VALTSRADAERDMAVDAATVIRLSTLSTDALTSSELDLTPRLDGLVMILEGLEEDLSRLGRVVVFEGAAGVAGLRTLALAAARSEPVVLPEEDLSKPRRVVIFEFVGWFVAGLRTLALAAARSEPAVDPEDDLSKPGRVVTFAVVGVFIPGPRTLALAAARSEPAVVPELDLCIPGSLMVFDFVRGVAGPRTLVLAAARSEPAVVPDRSSGLCISGA
jgi:hypothetical protein